MSQTVFRPYRYEGPVHAPFGALVEEQGRLICHVCGRSFVGLMIHVRRTHMSVADYKALFGLNRGTGLISASLRERQSAATTRRNRAGVFQVSGAKPPLWPRGRRREYRLERQLAQADRNRVLSASHRKPKPAPFVRTVCKAGHPWDVHKVLTNGGKAWRCGVCRDAYHAAYQARRHSA